MKFKVALVSFIIGLLLSFFLLMPTFITDNTEALLSDISQSLKSKNINFKYGQVDSKLFPLTLEIRNLKLETLKTPNIFTVEKITLTKWSLLSFVKILNGNFRLNDFSDLKVNIESLEVAEALLPTQLLSIAAFLGYEKLSFNILADYNYNKQDRKLSINEISIESPEIAKLKLSMFFRDVDLNTLLSASEEIEGSELFNDVSLESLNFEFKDLSLIRRYKEVVAATFSIDPMKTLAFLQSGSRDKRDPASQDLESKLKHSLYEFLLNPDTYQIQMHPERALSYKDMSIMLMLAPERLDQALNMKFEVNGKLFE